MSGGVNGVAEEPDPHAAAGAYVLDALDGEEREAFVRHLEGCAACAREVRELTATAALLGAAVAAPPPAGLRDAVFARIDGVWQEPAAGRAREVRADEPQEPAAGGAREVPEGAAAPGPGVRTGPRGGRAFGGRAFGGRAGKLVLAACLAVAAGLGGVAVWQWQEARDADERVREARQETDRLLAVLAAPDARSTTTTVGGGTRATVVVSRAENSAVFLASGLPRLPGDRTYQLWFDEDGAMRAAGLVGRDGASLMEGDVDGATGIGVTVEPAGGSRQPTTDPVMRMTLPV
ncbi:anti-sigma factor domain-containing protein [Streptomyces sp. NPDC015131]|uniref:anti-sigma factor n=1 Tax=Streptomyces sp. NPDC015131 TaxID=3364941 RepID=UPI0036F52456